VIASSFLPAQSGRMGWVRSGLFWRTFFLLSLLTTLSMGSWIGMLNVFQRGPQVRQTAELVVSVVTLTKAALTHSAPELRRELMFDLVSNEGVRIHPGRHRPGRPAPGQSPDAGNRRRGTGKARRPDPLFQPRQRHGRLLDQL
jgi:hypothetical protein